MSLHENKEELKGKVKNIHQELIEACKRGEQKAMFELYKLYYKSMYNTSLRIVGVAAEAEDVMQESFLDAFRKIGQYDAQATFGAWLKIIVVHKSIDHYKKKRREVPLGDISTNHDNNIEEDHLEVLSYKIAKIKEAINQLPEDYRIIISLHLLEGYDHEEISQILGITYENARTRYSRARKRLIHDLHEAKLSEAV